MQGRLLFFSYCCVIKFSIFHIPVIVLCRTSLYNLILQLSIFIFIFKKVFFFTESRDQRSKGFTSVETVTLSLGFHFKIKNSNIVLKVCLSLNILLKQFVSDILQIFLLLANVEAYVLKCMAHNSGEILNSSLVFLRRTSYSPLQLFAVLLGTS